jgi:CheY-like chemotaxis protein
MSGMMICDDLIFASRVTTTARAQRLQLAVAPSTDAALALMARSCPTAIILDLQNPGLNLSDFLEELAKRVTPRPRLIAYGSHVDVESLKAARAAGCERVMPRSQFVEQLESSLAEWLR